VDASKGSVVRNFPPTFETPTPLGLLREYLSGFLARNQLAYQHAEAIRQVEQAARELVAISTQLTGLTAPMMPGCTSAFVFRRA
jgi:hypothetical protein